MKLKTNLKLYLSSKNLTASDLSRASKVPKATISDWLAGRSPKNLNQLKSIASVLDLSIDDLVFGEFSENKRSDNHVSDFVSMGNFDVYLRKTK